MGVDSTGGYGNGIASNLMAEHHLDVYQYQGASAADDPQFADKVTENWWRMADQIKNGASIPEVDLLVGELTMRTYTSVHGRLKIEPKEIFSKRIHRSPDHADAYAGTFSVADQPAKSELDKALAAYRRSGLGKKKHDRFAKIRGRSRVYLDPRSFGALAA